VSQVIGLLTGAIGAGKTTVAQRVAVLAREQGRTCGGLLAPAILDGTGHKVGIWGIALPNGERRVLAHIEHDLGGPTVGPYSFDAAAVAWAVDSIESAVGHCDLLIVDEIGRLELESNGGLAPTLARLTTAEAQRWLLLVRESLLVKLQDRLGKTRSIVFEVTVGSRDGLPAQVLACLLSQAR